MDENTEIQQIKAENDKIKGTIKRFETSTRQMLFFGPYSLYDESLLFNKNHLTISTQKGSSSYHTIILLIPMKYFQLRVTKGKCCYGFVTISDLSVIGLLLKEQSND